MKTLELIGPGYMQCAHSFSSLLLLLSAAKISSSNCPQDVLHELFTGISKSDQLISAVSEMGEVYTYITCYVYIYTCKSI